MLSGRCSFSKVARLCGFFATGDVQQSPTLLWMFSHTAKKQHCKLIPKLSVEGNLDRIVWRCFCTGEMRNNTDRDTLCSHTRRALQGILWNTSTLAGSLRSIDGLRQTRQSLPIVIIANRDAYGLSCSSRLFKLQHFVLPVDKSILIHLRLPIFHSMSQQAFLPKFAFMWLCCMKLCSTFLISPKPYSRGCVNGVTVLVPSFVGKQSGISAKSFINNDAIMKFKSNRGALCKRHMSTDVSASRSQKTITVGVSDRANVMANGEQPVPLVLQLTGTINWLFHTSPAFWCFFHDWNQIFIPGIPLRRYFLGQ